MLVIIIQCNRYVASLERLQTPEKREQMWVAHTKKALDAFPARYPEFSNLKNYAGYPYEI